MSQRLTRRQMLRNAMLAGAGMCLADGHVWAQPAAPNEKLNIAVIGVGGRGSANLSGVRGENIVALCDVDELALERRAEDFPNARKYRDFRKMLDEMEKSIDAVVVSTPDHTHAPAAMMAIKLGKHCYCEKPLTHSVYEARAVTEAARENKCVTQIGTQIHAGTNYRRIVELIRSGAIGTVTEVHVWLGGGIGGGNRPAETPPVPPHLDWDLWLGPAPYRPYHPVYAPGGWRAWWDFGNGSLGDFGCHYMDIAFWALDLKYPTTIEAEGPPVHSESTPRALKVRYEFPARGEAPPVTLTWYHGAMCPGAKLVEPEPMPDWAGSGFLFVGSKGKLLGNYTQRMLLPQAEFADFEPPAPTIPNSIGHHQEWIVACKTGGATTCNFDYSGPLTETALLGNVAYRVGSKLEWDWANLKATNCPEADRYLRREYREGWTL